MATVSCVIDLLDISYSRDDILLISKLSLILRADKYIKF